MNCSKCGKPSDFLTRMNETGIEGIFWCEYCVNGTERPERKSSVFDDFKTYTERVDFQLKMWVGGKSLHNHVDDECCPDFSCCNADMVTDEETRKIFFNSCDEIRERFLMQFLGQAIAKYSDKKVYIADGKTEIDNEINKN